MLQATVCDGVALDALTFCEDRLSSAEVDVSRAQIVDALVIAGMIVMFDEGADLPFEVARQVVVVEQKAALQSLVPAFDLPLGLGMIRCTAHMLHTLVFEPPGQIVSRVTRSIVAEKPQPVRDGEQSLPARFPLWSVATTKKKGGTDTMQQYSIHKAGKQYVVRAKGKDLLICESRSEAENIVSDVASADETSMRRAGPLIDGLFCTNADVLAKVILDIKLILDIEKALRDDLATGEPRNQRLVQDQISTILDKAGAVGAAKRIQAGFRGLKVVK